MINLADWFRYNNVKSTDMGVYVLTYPPITLPEERVEFVAVLGHNGSLTITEGDRVYDDLTLSVDCMIRDIIRLDAVASWLLGSGDLIFGNLPDYYKARVVNQIELNTRKLACRWRT